MTLSFQKWFRLPQRVSPFVNDSVFDFDLHRLTRYINRCHDVLIDRFGWQLESLAENVEHPVAPNETNQVISPRLGLGERTLRCLNRTWEANDFAALFKHGLGCSTIQFTVSVTAIMVLLKQQGVFPQIFRIFHFGSSQEPISKVIVELFHHSIAPRLRHWDKPGLYVIEQAQPDQIAHSPWMLPTSKEHQLIVHLLILRNPQTAPDGPNSIYRVLACFTHHWANSAPSCGQIHAVQAVKSHWPAQITRTDKITLVNLIHTIRYQCWVLLSFWLVSSRAPMRKFFSTENPIDRPKRRQRLDSQRHQLPFDRLCTTKQSLIVETQPYQFHGIHNLIGQFVCVSVWPSRPPSLPLGRFITSLAAFYPLIDPLSRTTQRPRYRADAFAIRITFYCQKSVTLCFRRLHRRLPRKSRRQYQLGTAVSAKLTIRFQRTVNDVLALKSVNDVLALIT
jgi:hypothetical protein